MSGEVDKLEIRRIDASWFAGLALLAQVGFWFYASPWPQLSQPRDLSHSNIACLVSFLTLMVVPLIAWKFILRQEIGHLGLGKGDVSFGLKAVLILMPGFLIGTWIGSADPQIREFYPFPGDSVGESIPGLLIWFLTYLVYYVSFEVFYRGFLLHGIARQFQTSAAVAIGVSSVCCFLIHLGKPNTELLASLPASVLFGWIAWRSRSVWYGLLIHYGVGIVNDLGALK